MSENLKKSVAEVKELLELTKNGKPFSTIDNAAIIFREDPILGGNLKNNLFRERIELTGRMPWPRVTADVNDIDDVHIRHYFEKTYQLTSDKKIRDGMQIVASENGYHPVLEKNHCLDPEKVIARTLDHLLRLVFIRNSIFGSVICRLILKAEHICGFRCTYYMCIA